MRPKASSSPSGKRFDWEKVAEARWLIGKKPPRRFFPEQQLRFRQQGVTFAAYVQTETTHPISRLSFYGTFERTRFGGSRDAGAARPVRRYACADKDRGGQCAAAAGRSAAGQAGHAGLAG